MQAETYKIAEIVDKPLEFSLSYKTHEWKSHSEQQAAQG